MGADLECVWLLRWTAFSRAKERHSAQAVSLLFDVLNLGTRARVRDRDVRCEKKKKKKKNKKKKKPVLYLINLIFKRFSKKNFAENKQSPRLISLSLQIKFHISFLQQTLLRSSHLFLLNFQPEFD